MPPKRSPALDTTLGFRTLPPSLQIPFPPASPLSPRSSLSYPSRHLGPPVNAPAKTRSALSTSLLPAAPRPTPLAPCLLQWSHTTDDAATLISPAQVCCVCVCVCVRERMRASEKGGGGGTERQRVGGCVFVRGSVCKFSMNTHVHACVHACPHVSAYNLYAQKARRTKRLNPRRACGKALTYIYIYLYTCR